MGIYAGPSINDDGLILHLDAANTDSYPGTGTDWLDLSNNKLTGGMNGVTYAGDGTMFFDSVDDVDMTNTALLNPASITISAWVKFANFTTYRTICARWSATSAYSAYYFTNFNGTAKIDLYIYAGGTKNLRSTDDVLVAGEWCNVVATYDSGSGIIKIYKDAVDIPGNAITGTGSIQQSTGSITGIGRDINRNIYPFAGNMGMLSMYNRALTLKEIEQNYLTIKGRFGL